MIIGEETARKYLTADDVIDVCEKTWRWYGEGRVVMPNKITTDMTSFDVVRKADKIAVDRVGQSLHRGNVKELAEMGEITADSFDIIIPDVLAGANENLTAVDMTK